MDLISRKAAIEALGEKPLAWTDSEYELALQQQWESDVDAIKAVPSAQLEIIRCKDCKEYYFPSNQMQIEHLWTCMRYGLPRNADDFCSRGKRRSDGR